MTSGLNSKKQKNKIKHISSLNFLIVINWVMGPPQCDIWISGMNGNCTIFSKYYHVKIKLLRRGDWEVSNEKTKT